MIDESAAIKKSLEPMFKKARAEKLWFFWSWQQLALSPDELEAHQAKGRFLWSPENWELIDPVDLLVSADKAVARAQEERDKLAQRIRGGKP